ncbi:family 43 glycosylhydrolase [Curtobacterium sp. AB451]|uniref:hypothetical protein n=1 Tax=unclassified Curtobacterium TaxID=257496 RepID=UPI00382798D8
MSAGILRTPQSGATDPTLVHDPSTGQWWMFTTLRRPHDDGPGVRWVHGSSIGIATSDDDGATWSERGAAHGLPDADTCWAPEVVRVDDGWRMFLTVVDGVPSSWDGASGHVVEFRSGDLERWERVGTVDLRSDRVIDACVARCDDGRWRLWAKDEHRGSCTVVASSADLVSWTHEGVAVPATPPHEGPVVFRLGRWWWMVTDEWRGLAVHRSPDARQWTRQSTGGGLVLDRPGRAPDDTEIGHHASVVVAASGQPHGVLVYFTHPGGPGTRESAVHFASVRVESDVLVVDRDDVGAHPLAGMVDRGVPRPTRDAVVAGSAA